VYLDYNNKQNPVCKYGSGCYRKNKEHLQKYYHPPASEAKKPVVNDSSDEEPMQIATPKKLIGEKEKTPELDMSDADEKSEEEREVFGHNSDDEVLHVYSQL
jgi:hypothetical protein